VAAKIVSTIRRRVIFSVLLALSIGTGLPLYAQSPWENAVQALQTSFTGPIPYGWLWHAAHEFASGPETRFQLLLPLNGSEKSANGWPVPFVSGRPPPSCSVQFALNSILP
jgi:hypothetical protein